ncbi:FkbM family methyltransferase [Acuticoccus sp. I52.16.1]|uniref:FkbM family methyltransferase n=1 Tax=Acuticoccus sp. I52.16.1 TaxID=2928472 RepID=UPI001FD40F23|nr:FkbM family methyltransferase [Acuticoccus sp. I52.16.1]UOM37196.1 FkbM family methyltransferase [Acuticoccus sp. I52.16.1]
MMIRRRLRYELAAGEPELHLLALFADAHRSFVDVGANEGVYAWHARGSFRHLYVVEANPSLAATLRHLFSRAEATVIEKAASDHAQPATFTIPVKAGEDVHSRGSLEAQTDPDYANRSITVRAERLDAMDLERVGLIKIDVEGHEMAAVEGASGILERDRPVLIVECEERHHAGGVATLLAHMSARDYDPYYLHRGQVRPGASYDVAALQNPDAQKAPGAHRSPDYVNNFVFVHRADEKNRAALLAGVRPPQSLAPS